MRTLSTLAAILLQFVTIVHSLQASEYLGKNQRSGYTNVTVPAKPALLWT